METNILFKEYAAIFMMLFCLYLNVGIINVKDKKGEPVNEFAHNVSSCIILYLYVCCKCYHRNVEIPKWKCWNLSIFDGNIYIFESNKRRYGVRRVHQELINRGYQVNHKRVQRLMHEAGFAGKRPKEKYHSYKGEVGKIADRIPDRTKQ